MVDNNHITYPQRLRLLECAVVIPTYNNDKTLSDVIASVKLYCDDIFVVNDGSTDSTANILRATDHIHVIEYGRNRGKGYALRQGLRAAVDAGFRYAITIDSDGQHFADDIPLFVERIEQHPDSLLIGARNLSADNMPSKNSFANRFSNFWYRVETGHELSDTQSGFRLYPLRRIANMWMICRGYEFEVEVIVRATWRGVAVQNLPIRVYYAPEGERVSHFRPLRDFARISILNTFLVLGALLFHYPWRFFRSLTRENIRDFVRQNITHSPDSNLRLASAMGWGVFCGIVPLWGYQMIFAGVTAHFMRLNKLIALVFSNISIPPMIPLILYSSFWVGSKIVGRELSLNLSDISFQAIADDFVLYVIGSVSLAIICGVLIFLLSWILCTLLKPISRHE